MYTVSNRFLVKKGMGHKIAPAFTSEKELLDFEGFHKVEVSVCTQNREHDEMNVMMYWQALENFQTWRASDSFKKLHARDAQSNGESPIISNQIVIAEIVATLSI
ncbi:heme-degrading monooxygenase IsdG [[Bacillus] sp. KCTC 13219]|nr:antibiotic biosynthesis monooxygenase [Metasolibacillus fluoroglycofenilyticus]KYG89876.1 heme-degrading monooxygenase IsdG [[Bacillus] sp. KCTC 13219]